ncbi:MAG: endonuclease III [Phycisphaerales bacterium]|nr:endonuclease III [Phycisphaerales bacterium]
MKPQSHNVDEVWQRLRKRYGPRPAKVWGRGIDVLVETILSQNTSNQNSSAAYRQLRRRFRTWNEVADAPVEEVERWIRTAGLSRLKAPRIQTILRQLREERGRISLEFLKRLPPDQAAAYLRRFKGIGPKTIACLLLFAFQMPVFPVDTHIHRIARRLHWIGPKVSAEKAHILLEPAIPPAQRYEMHILLIAHGRQTCRAINPTCDRCPLLDLCPSGGGRSIGILPMNGCIQN